MIIVVVATNHEQSNLLVVRAGSKTCCARDNTDGTIAQDFLRECRIGNYSGQPETKAHARAAAPTAGRRHSQHLSCLRKEDQGEEGGKTINARPRPSAVVQANPSQGQERTTTTPAQSRARPPCDTTGCLPSRRETRPHRTHVRRVDLSSQSPQASLALLRSILQLRIRS